MQQPTFKQFLTELFDQGFEWEWTKQETKEFQAKFETEQYGYQVEISSDESGWYVDFAAREKGKLKDHSEIIDTEIDTEENVSSRVMATVLNIIKDFVNMVNPDIITFKAEKNKLGRAGFYEKMLQRVLPDEYKVEKDRDGNMIEFRIVKSA